MYRHACLLIPLCMLVVPHCLFSADKEVSPKENKAAQPSTSQPIFNIHNDNKHYIGQCAHSGNQTRQKTNNMPGISTTTTIDTSNISSNTNQNSNTNTTHVNIHIVMEQVIRMFKYTYQQARTFDPHKQARTAKKIFSDYTFEIIAGSGAAAYLSLCGQLIYVNHYLKRADAWSRWKNHLKLSELYQIPQQELAKDLIRTIQYRYMTPNNPTDIIIPLVRFVQALDTEMKYIKRYISLSTGLDQLHILVAFPATQKTIKRARRQLKRLQFVKHVFASWAVEYSMHTVGGLKVAKPTKTSTSARCRRHRTPS